MAVKITGIEAGSAAEKCGIIPGEVLLEINGHPIADILDYRFYVTEKTLLLKLSATTGELYEKRVKKREYDDLGLEFETYLMDSKRFCKNKCIFCFIDQMPENMRDSLYFKDDDSRMSFLFGNYITLTNLSDGDIDRIISMHTSPVNISVHTMNPELRVKMMKNPNAGDSLRFIKRLTDADIKVNAQLVLCPGINDGNELERSLTELCALAPNLQSVAAVPVGLTKFRDRLPMLRMFTPEESACAIDAVEAFAKTNLKRYGSRVCFAADEFYLNAGREFPPYEAYEEFDQLENGVGLLPLLQHEFDEALESVSETAVKRSITIATGVAAKPALCALAKLAACKITGLDIKVTAIGNKFFGESVTVAGLVTGTDLINQLKRAAPVGELLIPAVMLRHERDLFLDGVSLDDVERELGCTVTPVENDGYELLDAILGKCGLCKSEVRCSFSLGEKEPKRPF